VAFSCAAVPRFRARKNAHASIIDNVKEAVPVSFRCVKPAKKNARSVFAAGAKGSTTVD
jgi:hypothetical protein